MIGFRLVLGQTATEQELAACVSTLRQPQLRSALDGALAAWVLGHSTTVSKYQDIARDIAWAILAQARGDEDRIRRENRDAWNIAKMSVLAAWTFSGLVHDTNRDTYPALRALTFLTALAAIGTNLTAILTICSMALARNPRRTPRAFQAELLTMIARTAPIPDLAETMEYCVRHSSASSFPPLYLAANALETAVHRAALGGFSYELAPSVETNLARTSSNDLIESVIRVFATSGTTICVPFLKNAAVRRGRERVHALAIDALDRVQARVTAATSNTILLRPADQPDSEIRMLLRPSTAPVAHRLLVTPAPTERSPSSES